MFLQNWIKCKVFNRFLVWGKVVASARRVIFTFGRGQKTLKCQGAILVIFEGPRKI